MALLYMKSWVGRQVLGVAAQEALTLISIQKS